MNDTKSIDMEWISVDERMPEEARNESKFYRTGWIVTDREFVWATFTHPANWNTSDDDRTITHWMPLPAPPAGDKDE